MRLAILLAVTGCATDLVGAEAIETGDLAAHYTIAHEPGGVRARAAYQWLLGDGARVVFDDGERISVDGIELVERDFDDVFEVAVTTGIEHAFVLQRLNEPPIEHRVAEATPFTVASAPTTATSDSEIVITWAPIEEGDTVDIAAIAAPGSACPSTTLTTARPDTGTFTVSGANLGSGRPCELALQVTRSNTTFVAPQGLAGVRIERQHRATTTLLLR